MGQVEATGAAQERAPAKKEVYRCRGVVHGSRQSVDVRKVNSVDMQAGLT
jgi:hypothetical protein